MAEKINRTKSITVSTLLTLAIIGMLVLSGPAMAVTVKIIGLSGAIQQGKSKTFFVDIKVKKPDQYVPVDNFTLNITGPTTAEWTFDVAGTILSGPPEATITPESIPESSFGYGAGVGVDSGTNYVLGYGYGYGTGQGTITFRYQVTLNTAILSQGNYNAVARLNTGRAAKPSFDSDVVTFRIR